MSSYGRPTAAELVAAVADFLDTDVRAATDGQVAFHARVAANVLRTVERELLDETAGEVSGALDDLGFADETQLAAAIRAGDLDGRAGEVLPCLRTLVRHRLASRTRAMTRESEFCVGQTLEPGEPRRLIDAGADRQPERVGVHLGDDTAVGRRLQRLQLPSVGERLPDRPRR